MDNPDPLVDDHGMETDLAMNNSGSSIATLEPYSSPVLGNPEKRLKLREKRNEKVNKREMIQILPGVFELISYDKFLVIEFENLVGNVNPFKANKEIMSICGKEPKIRTQGDGSLLIEVTSPEESGKLMKMTKLVGHNVKCIPHPTFNQCRGVIYAPELLSIDASEIQSELEDQNVVKVVRMMKKARDQLLPLPTLILTFRTYRMPNNIKAGWLNFRVKPYIPSPLRCYHCHMYGHSIQKCKKRMNQEPSICVNCGKNTHGECKENPKCINCGEMHPANSKSCIRYVYEKEVQAIRVTEKVSFREAKRKALDKQIRPGESFSSVLRKVRADKPQETQPAKPSSVQQNANIPPSQQEDQVAPYKPNSSQQNVDIPLLQQENQVVASQHLPIIENPVVSKKKDISYAQIKNKSSGQTLINSKDSPSTSGMQIKSSTPRNSKSKKKRERTPEEKFNQSDKNREMSSQSSVVIPRNAVKLKRLENK